MTADTLAPLRCPFCGTRVCVVDNPARQEVGDTIVSAVLGCECCTFPVVDGIPVLMTNDRTREAMHTLEAGHPDAARHLLLGLDRPGAAALSELLTADRIPTYRELLSLLSVDAEADYFLHRFSDPTYRVAEALLRVITHSERRAAAGSAPSLDLCGGSGHLTRVLMARPSAGDTMLADLHFWKLWLAARVPATGCIPICCDASSPLPFVSGHFSTVVLSDAFPYIWHKRLCAQEMMRVAADDGVILMPHLHSALGKNVSAGDTLTPSAYRDLYAPTGARLFDDRRLLDDLLERQTVDLTADATPDALGATDSVTLVASADPTLFAAYPVAVPGETRDTLAVNPLYRIDYNDGRSQLTLEFPTREYEDEYSATKQYLPGRVSVDADLRGPITADLVGNDYAELRRRCVLLDLPHDYCWSAFR